MIFVYEKQTVIPNLDYPETKIAISFQYETGQVTPVVPYMITGMSP